MQINELSGNLPFSRVVYNVPRLLAVASQPLTLTDQTMMWQSLLYTHHFGLHHKRQKQLSSLRCQEIRSTSKFGKANRLPFLPSCIEGMIISKTGVDIQHPS